MPLEKGHLQVAIDAFELATGSRIAGEGEVERIDLALGGVGVTTRRAFQHAFGHRAIARHDFLDHGLALAVAATDADRLGLMGHTNKMFRVVLLSREDWGYFGFAKLHPSTVISRIL